jgi:hypothetical protein
LGHSYAITIPVVFLILLIPVVLRRKSDHGSYTEAWLWLAVLAALVLVQMLFLGTIGGFMYSLSWSVPNSYREFNFVLHAPLLVVNVAMVRAIWRARRDTGRY